MTFKFPKSALPPERTMYEERSSPERIGWIFKAEGGLRQWFKRREKAYRSYGHNSTAEAPPESGGGSSTARRRVSPR